LCVNGGALVDGVQHAITVSILEVVGAAEVLIVVAGTIPRAGLPGAVFALGAPIAEGEALAYGQKLGLRLGEL
jgi:hypothetical protein